MGTVCAGWSIVNDLSDNRRAICMYCQRWSCTTCQPRRHKRLIAEVFSGRPERWMTLTIDARRPETALEAFDALRKAFNDLQKRIRRRYPAKRFEYVAVAEATKLGNPHLHIAFRGPWIDQKWLSEQMNDLIGSPICDVRWLHGKKQTMSYICKYVGKAPHQFGTHKRYWFSRAYREDSDAFKERDPARSIGWRVMKCSIDMVARLWVLEGFDITDCDVDSFEAKRRC